MWYYFEKKSAGNIVGATYKHIPREPGESDERYGDRVRARCTQWAVHQYGAVSTRYRTKHIRRNPPMSWLLNEIKMYEKLIEHNKETLEFLNRELERLADTTPEADTI